MEKYWWDTWELKKTNDIILTNYYCSNLDADINQRIKICLNCQLKKKSSQKQSPMAAHLFSTKSTSTPQLIRNCQVIYKQEQLHYLYDRWFHQVCRSSCHPKQRSWNRGYIICWKMYLLIQHASTNTHRWGKIICQQIVKRNLPKTGHSTLKNTPYHLQCSATVKVFNKTKILGFSSQSIHTQLGIISGSFDVFLQH